MGDETMIPASSQNVWLQYAPKPRSRPPGTNWDVFISYRSVSRAWAFALHDTLREAGFSVFLDQYVLVPGQRLDRTLEQHLRASASAVLIWTRAAADSEWVAAEYDKMKELVRTRPEFHFVIAKLDQTPLPFLEAQTKYIDFTNYPEGPRGGELLQLMYGLNGEPLSLQAMRAVRELDEESAQILRTANAAREIGDAAKLLELGRSERPVLLSTPLLISVIAEALIALKKNDEALKILEIARQRFPKSIRPQQLAGLACRRKKDLHGAQTLLAALYSDGHRDPETLGIYAATWADRYRKENNRAYLERSQSLYEQAFRVTPSDYYVGLNAASKLALLGRADEAKNLADEVLKLVSDATDGTDYWKTASHAEVRLLLGEPAVAAALYRKAAVAHSDEAGSIQSTRDQLDALIPALNVAETDASALRKSLDVGS